MLALALALLALTATQARSFNITDLQIPKIVAPDQEEIEIECAYDGNFTILNWFKGRNEFFRYKPGVAPSTLSFPIFGIGRIEIINCGPYNCRLRLGSLTEEATGLYKCTIERGIAPYKFATKSAYMQVDGHQLRRRPKVEGLAEEYGEGDDMMAYCRAAPGAEIRWYINSYETTDMRGSEMFKKRSSWVMFMGMPPKVSIKCAEFRYGNLLGSKEVIARWIKSTIKKERAQERRNNSAPIKKNNDLLWIYLLFYANY